MLIAKFNDELISASDYIDRRDQGFLPSDARPEDPLTGELVSPVREHPVRREYAEFIRSAHWRVRTRNERIILDDVFPDDDIFERVDGGVVRKGESPEHMLAKKAIYETLCKAIIPGRERVCFEHIVVMTSPGHSGKKRRICDVAEVFKNGDIASYEVQLSRITPEDLQSRTDDYEENGVNVFWFLGKNADTNATRQWHLDYFGVPARILEFELEGERTKTQIN